MNSTHETVLSASQTARQLLSDMHEAQKKAVKTNPLLVVALRDILVQVVEVDRRLSELDSILEGKWPEQSKL